ncbi:unnamed protein product [Spirodela intermedia]|uniref:Fe2OG dioxygenase domain-containing protein n=1 Tax=Spirodela intermedia TaxID=51605 RepID=A0A7I8JXV1_SPIIN|nr:unnamed protein product [Spirodela intermedia]
MGPEVCSGAGEIRVGRVDDVQELGKAQPAAVPERYLRDGGDRPSPPPPVGVHSEKVPVVDMSKLAVGGGHGDGGHELAKLASACEEWGFFQVVNHGVEEELMARMEALAMEFFMLPLEEKERYPMAPGTVQGYGHAFVFSADQKLDWCNMLGLGLEPPSIRVPELWPANPPLFSETLELYSAEIGKLCRRLLALVAASLGLPLAAFDAIFSAAVQAVRMNYYPPCPWPDLVLGLSPHSDGSALTVLHQHADSAAGLQVLKGGAWFPVLPLPGALVVNIGDTLEVLTNGKYQSVEHRAVTSEERERLSLVTFFAPGYDVQIGPLPEFVGAARPCRYRSFNHGEYNRHYLSRRLQGKMALNFALLDASEGEEDRRSAPP